MSWLRHLAEDVSRLGVIADWPVAKVAKPRSGKRRDPHWALGLVWISVLLLVVGLFLGDRFWLIFAAVFGLEALLWVWLRRRETRAGIAQGAEGVAKLDFTAHSPQYHVRACRWDAVGSYTLDDLRGFTFEMGKAFPVGDLNAWNKVEDYLRSLFDTDDIKIEVDRVPRTRKFVVNTAPDIPTFCRPEVIERPWWEIELGKGANGRTVVWNLKLLPHALVAAPTGSGKTAAARAWLQQIYAAILRALAEDEQTWIPIGIDPKRLGLKFMRGRPNTLAVGTSYEAIHNTVERVHDEMMAWYGKAENSQVMPDLLRYFIVIEEYAALATMDGTNANSIGPVCAMLANIGRLGREAGIHMLVIMQQPAARFMTTEFRDNLGMRIALGPLSAEGSKMVFRDTTVGVGIPVTPGRALAQINEIERDWLQVPWVADPDRIDYGLADNGFDPKQELDIAASLFPARVTTPDIDSSEDWRGPEELR